MCECAGKRDQLSQELAVRLKATAPEDVVSRSEPIFSFDLLDVPALDDLAQDALIEKILDIEFRYFRITQSDDLLDSSQALCSHKCIRRRILQKIFVADLGELPVHLDMFLQNGEAPFFLRAHDCASLDKRFDKVLYALRVLLDKRLRAHERAGWKRDPA